MGFTPATSSTDSPPQPAQPNQQQQQPLVEDDDSDEDEEEAGASAVGQSENRDGTLLASDRARPLPSNQVRCEDNFRLTDGWS